jgi:hypothetical protein
MPSQQIFEAEKTDFPPSYPSFIEAENFSLCSQSTFNLWIILRNFDKMTLSTSRISGRSIALNDRVISE